MVELNIAEAEPQLRVGRIKWFSSPKGFGFLTCVDYERDVLLHASVLGEFAGRALPIGAEVEFFAVESEHGPRVNEIVSMVLVASDEADVFSEDLAAIPLQSARVKWYDMTKGFGFANCFGKSEDVFLHATVVNKFGQWDLREGEAVSLRVQETERGLIAVDIRPWDEAIPAV